MSPAPSIFRRAHRRGFTLVEVALCIGIIGFALVAIIGILPTGLRVQQENREDTLINQDAQYLLEAIRSGAAGPVAIVLTNFVERIEFGTTNHVHGAALDQFNTGFEILGLLSRPQAGQRVIMRNISGTASDLSASAVARNFAFTYAVFVDLQPSVRQVGVVLPNRWNPTVTNYVLVTNHYELSLDFRWPLLPNGATGSGRKVFRTLIAGRLEPVTPPPPSAGFIAPIYLFSPQTFNP